MLHRGFRIDDHMPTPLLVALLTGPAQPPSKRWAACLALGTKPEAGAFRVLRAALRDDDWQIRRLALESIKRHPLVADAAEDILAMLFDVDDQVRQTACKVCGELGLRRAHDGIRTLLRAENPDVRDSALNTLARVWHEEDFEPVFRLYQEDERRAVRIAAAKTLRKRATPKTWRRLFDVWRCDRETRHRLWSCELAAEFGGPRDLKAIEPLLLDRNPNVRRAAWHTHQALSA